jgi:hypothetical protein
MSDPLHDLVGIKILIDPFLPDDTFSMNQKTFDKLQSQVEKVQKEENGKDER